MPPSVSVPVALVAFTVVVFAAFKRVGPRRAVLGAFIGGAMFVPVFDTVYQVPLLRTKLSFIGGVTLAMSLLLDRRRWRRLHLELRDVPVLVLGLVPFASSLSNDLGAWDGFTSALSSSMVWCAPYFLGRLYLGEPRAAADLAQGIVKGALLYAPFCLWEVRMSPQLNHQVFGFGVGAWDQNVRFEGWRPTVFMSHGLMVGMFMACGTLLAYWLLRTGAVRRVWGVPMAWCCLLLVVTTVLVKSLGAIVLLTVGVGILEYTRRYKGAALVLMLLLVPPTYVVTRTVGLWSGQELVELARQTVGPARAQSLGFRFENENLLVDKALKQPLFGWGGWGRSFVNDENGRNISIVDGMWIIYLGSNGLVALAALLLTLALPVLALLRRFPVAAWADPRLSALSGLAMITLLWAVDDLLNSMMVPWFPLACGALTAIVRWRPPPRTVRVRAAEIVA